MWQYGLEECGPVALSQELPLVPGGERRLGGICMTPLEVMTMWLWWPAFHTAPVTPRVGEDRET